MYCISATWKSHPSDLLILYSIVSFHGVWRDTGNLITVINKWEVKLVFVSLKDKQQSTTKELINLLLPQTQRRGWLFTVRCRCSLNYYLTKGLQETSHSRSLWQISAVACALFAKVQSARALMKLLITSFYFPHSFRQFAIATTCLQWEM